MRRVAAVLLALALTACGGGGGPRPTPSAPTPSSSLTTGGVASLAYATDQGVFAVAPDGTRTTLQPGVVAAHLAVSPDGRYVAYVVEVAQGFALAVHDVTANRATRWTSPDAVAREVAFARGGFVVVDGRDKYGLLLLFDPAGVVAGGEPRSVSLRPAVVPRLLAARGQRILVAGGARTGPRGGPETVYEVDDDGDLTPLFTDTGHTLRIGAAGITADGTRVVYGSGVGGTTTETECDLGFDVVVRSLPDGRVVRTGPMPSLGDDVLTVADSVTDGAEGRVVVGFGTELGGCSQDARSATYALVRDRWVEVHDGVRWSAVGRDGRVATISTDDVLRIEGEVVARGVTHAAWAVA